jgi:hypothetical protein
MPAKPKKSYTLGQKGSAENLHDLELPSGATCQARRPGAQGMIEAGLLDNFDDLTALVKTEHVDPNMTGRIAGAAKVMPEEAQAAAKAMTLDKAKFEMALEMVDRLTAYVVVQPVVWVDYQLKNEPDDEWNRRQEHAAKNEAVDVRAVDLDDKMFLLQWAVGGSADLTAFREGSGQLMGNLAAS